MDSEGNFTPVEMHLVLIFCSAERFVLPLCNTR